MPFKKNAFNHLYSNDDREKGIIHEDVTILKSNEIIKTLNDRPDLKKKFELFDGRESTPKYLFEIESLDNMSIESIREKINLTDRLKYGYGVIVTKFQSWKNDLSKVNLNKELERKLELFKGKPYAPKFLSDIELLNNMDTKEIINRIRLAEKTMKGLLEYGITDYCFSRFMYLLDKTDLTEENKKKLELIKTKPYDPKYATSLNLYLGMTIDEINKYIELATLLEKENIKVDLCDFVLVLPKVNQNNNLKEEFEKNSKRIFKDINP